MYLELETEVKDERPVFLTGDFCNWDPLNPDYLLERIDQSRFRISVDKVPNLLENTTYKYTKGGWDNVELDVYGNSPKNRVYTIEKSDKPDFVPLWRQNGYTPFHKDSMPILEIFSEAFDIPQLNRKRKISVLLPHDYYTNLDKSYPVMYMNDAQNLFGKGSKYGNWEIDKRLSLLKQHDGTEAIVVAIDHGGGTRNTEYSPYKFPNKNDKSMSILRERQQAPTL